MLNLDTCPKIRTELGQCPFVARKYTYYFFKLNIGITTRNVHDKYVDTFLSHTKTIAIPRLRNTFKYYVLFDGRYY